MADNNEQKDNLEPEAQVPSDADLFAGSVQNEYTAQEIFAGDNALYQVLAKAESEGTPSKPEKPQHTKEPKLKLSAAAVPNFSPLQKVLISAILGVALVLTYAVVRTPKNTLADANLDVSPDINEQSTPPVTVKNVPEKSPVRTPETPRPSEPNEFQAPAYDQFAQDTPLSLKIAQSMIDGGEFRQAYSVYHQIQQYLPPGDKQEPFYDFLTLHKGLCLTLNRESIHARRTLALAAKSKTPTIRVMANYHLSRLELSQNQFMQARARACEALCLLDALQDHAPEWLLDLKQTCCFLVAQATSKQALILCDADKQLPSHLNPTLPAVSHPWHNLNEVQLRETLANESGFLSSILLTPSISNNDKKPQTPWSVSCHRMAVDELIARFGANASMEVVWHDEANVIDLRQRAISMSIENVSDQTIVSLAAGSTGLLAQIDDSNTIHVMNPVSASFVSEQVTMLAQEATLMWQRHLFSGKDSPYFATAHFTSGLLYQQLALRAAALSEFKLVSSRYARTNLAPYALLYSSYVKEELHDAAGVQDDLKLLVEQYPDVPIVTEAFLRLAQTVAQLGKNEEAAKIYRKVFYLNLSEESRATSALNAGRCFFNTKEYDSAELWLTQYLQLMKGRKAEEVDTAYFILGKSLLALDKTKMACLAFQNALQGNLGKGDYLETMAKLVQGYMQQQDLMEAIDALENADNAELAPSDMLELNLLKSTALRHAGFVDRAIELLENTKSSVASPTLNARLSLELSLNLIDKGDLTQAQDELSRTLVKVESGPLAHQIALTLAQVCLDLKQEDQAVSVCQSVLQLEPAPSLSIEVSELLAKAYTNQQNYEKAAQVLIKQWK